jgi:hypothetical protein
MNHIEKTPAVTGVESLPGHDATAVHMVSRSPFPAQSPPFPSCAPSQHARAERYFNGSDAD